MRVLGISVIANSAVPRDDVVQATRTRQASLAQSAAPGMHPNHDEVQAVVARWNRATCFCCFAASSARSNREPRKRRRVEVGGAQARRQVADRSRDRSLVHSYAAGEIDDDAMTQWLRANAGMSIDETRQALTRAMASSGETIEWSSVGGAVVDEHFDRGGVGDAVSLVAVPLAAACGARVANFGSSARPTARHSTKSSAVRGRASI